MKIISLTDTVPAKNYIATIGFFDGVHIGHRYLLDKLKQEAKKLGAETLVISFDKHPKTILPTDYIPELLTSNDEKIERLNEFGIDACTLLSFDKDMANLTAFEFIKNIIVDKLGVHTLYIGYDHRFGKNRKEGFEEYVKYGDKLGIDIKKADSYSIGDTQVSSSVIRRLIHKGDLEKANSYLTYTYSINGVVVKGDMIGNTIGYPTANIDPSNKNKIIPSNGVYIARIKKGNKTHNGMVNIGSRPTLKKTNKITIEANIFDFNKNVYGENLTIEFLKKIRNEVKFNSINELVQEIDKDKEISLEYFKQIP